MLFDDLIKKALDDETEPLRDLFAKAFDWEAASAPDSSFKKKPHVAATPAPAPAAPAAKTPKVKVKAASPNKAKIKTGIQIDKNTQPVKQTIVTPDGPQQKTFHEGPGGMNTNTQGPLIIPPTKVGPKNKKQKATPDVTYKTKKDGKVVATGHNPDQVPADFKLDSRGQWYHDRLKVGDKVGFNGWSEEFNHWVPVESEVSELNPNGTTLIHAKPLHKDAVNDPEAEPLKVHYNKLHFFRRKDDANPGQWHHFEYPGEYENASPTDPQGANPSPVMTPEEHHAHAVHQQELVKLKTDSIKKYLEGGDVVEFWMRDPMTNKLVLNRGTIHNMAAMGGPGAKGGGAGAPKGKAGKDGEAPEINNVIVQTKEGYEDVPLDQIKRFGKYVVDELHLYSFDPKQQKWQRDGKSAQEVQPADEQKPEATGVPTNQLHPATLPQGVAASEGPSAPQPAIPENEGKDVTTTPQATQHNFAEEPQEPSHVIMNAGAKYIDEDPEDGIVYFQDPESGRVHGLPKEEITTQNVLSKMGKLPNQGNKDGFHTPDEVEQHQQQDIKNHWTHQLPEDLVGHIRGLVDKVDKYSNNGEPLPVGILMARHRLLHDYDPKKAIKNAAQIEEFLQHPNAIPKVKPSLQRQDFQKKFNGVKNFDSVSFEDAKDKLGTNKPAHPLLESKQQAALGKLDETAQKNGLPGFSGAIHQINPKVDNRNLINFYKTKLEDALKEKGITHEPINLGMPTDENIDYARHVNEMAQHLKNNNLLIPAYRKKLEQLNYFLENSPDSPVIEKLMNQIHKYGYVHGPNDPRYKAAALEQQINELPKGKYDPDAIKKLQYVVGRINNGDVPNPADYVMLAHKIAEHHGIPLKELPEQQFNASNQAKAKLDALVEHRKVAEQQKQMEAEQQKVKAEQTPDEPPQAALPQDAQQQQQYVQGSLNMAKRLLQGAQNNEKVYNSILQQLHDQHITKPDHETLVTLRNIYNSVKESEASLKKYQGELAKFGVQMPDWASTIQPVGNGKVEDNKDNPALEQLHNRMSQNFNNFDEKKKVWLENQVGFTHNDVQQIRNHFLSGVNQQLPSAQQDLKNIDQAVGDMLNQQKWQPLDVALAKTPQGKHFIEMVNEKVERLKKREQLAGVTIDEALGKSIEEIIAAEKILARRDVSLALRKAFSNEKDSAEVVHATQLLGAYVDDFVNTIMTTYKNIPVTVRKSIVRKLMKSMILSVIKDNEFSAIGMKADFTVPLDEPIVKALGQRIATVVTEFRLEANPKKQMFVIDVAKSDGAASQRPEYFTHSHKLIKAEEPITQDIWLPLMVDLEEKMCKAGLLETSISPFRIKKFIADNDNKTLIEFYNENVELLNSRLEELQHGRG